MPSTPSAARPWGGPHRTVWAIVIALVVAALGAAGWGWHARDRFDMVRVLAEIARNQGTWDNPWDLQERKIASLKAELAAERRPTPRLILKREIAQQYVNGGTPEPAIALLEATLAEYGDALAPQDAETLKSDIAFAYYRIGEQQNCAARPNANVCIVPLKGGGVHQAKLGAAEAAKRYEALLAEPDVSADGALIYRWMLNIVYMQLGRYPDGVPPRWRLEPKAFGDDADIGAFTDIAATRGIVEFGRAGGAILEDFDNDGHLDLMVSHMGVDDQLQYFHNDGNGHYTRRTREAGLEGLFGGLNMVQADIDNDGCIDVYIPRGAWYHDHGKIPASLLHNNCDGTFTDIGKPAGVMNGLPSQAAVFADFDLDGRVDLFVGNEIVREKVAWPADTASFRLYLNRGGGRFDDVAGSSRIRVDGMIKGVTAGDFDNDGWPDLYVSVMGKPNHLFRNLGGSPPRFEDVTARAGVAEPVMSFTTWFFDFDNDGWLDIFVSGYDAPLPSIVRERLGDKAHAKGERPRLYRNNGNGTFTDVSREMHLDALLLTMGANYGDLDNDGWLDFYLGTGAAPLFNVVPNQMFRNDAGRAFRNVTVAGGFGHLQKGHAVAFGDIDNTGNLDVFANIGGAMVGDKFYSVLFKNPGHPQNHWVKLDLSGVQANRYAIGARLRVRALMPDGQARDIHTTIGSGGSFGSSPLAAHVGVGSATSIGEIEIRWPGSGTVQRVTGRIAVDARYALREGESVLRTTALAPKR